MIIDSDIFHHTPKSKEEAEALVELIGAEIDAQIDALDQTDEQAQKAMDVSAVAQLASLMDRAPRRYDHGEPEARMTRRQLYKIARYAQEIHDALRDEDNLPEWVQSKVAVMDANIGSVKHFLEYRDARGHY